MAISNKDVEVLSEAMFCYYFAIWKQGKKKQFDPKSFEQITNYSHLTKWVGEMGIGSIVTRVSSDGALKSRINKINEFLNDKGWHERLVAQLDAFMGHNKIKVGAGRYEAMRADMLPPAISPYRAYNQISKKVKGKLGFKGRVDKDKWNPSDVWIMTTKVQTTLKQFVSITNQQIFNNPEYCVDYVNKLNRFIQSQFQRGQLFPVSLKAPSGQVKIVFENDRYSSVKKVVRYTKIEFTDSNQDAKIRFSVDKVDYDTGRVEKRDYIKGSIKTKTVKSGGARLEIEGGSGSGARYGSMGTENYQWIIKETDNTGIKELNNIRNKSEFDNLKTKYWSGTGGKEWLGRGKYVKEFNKQPQIFAEEIKPYTQILFSKINNGRMWDAAAVKSAKSEEEKWLNKTHAGEVAIAVDRITNKVTRDITVENLFNLAASQGFGAGISKAQVEVRKRQAQTLGQKLGEGFQAVPIDESNKIWSSCFYVVVK
tara:strand:+ start:1061 stop:2503 length:1443 start_codon:yes stop_codon:yes gene_type:complete